MHQLYRFPFLLLLGVLFLMAGPLDALAQTSEDEAAKEAHAASGTATPFEAPLILNKANGLFHLPGQTDQAPPLGSKRGAPRTRATGGPDGFGYRYIDSNEVGGPVYQLIEISGSGTLVAQGDDVSSNNSGIFSPVALGAPFSFYGTVQTTAVPATNGYLSLGGPDNDSGPDLSNDCPIPSNPSTGGSGPLGRIYILHDDMVAGGGFGFPTGGVYYEYFAAGSCPHPRGAVSGGCSVFHYHDANHFAGGGPFDYEALLFDNGDILMQYGPGNPELGAGSTEGLQDYDPDGPGGTPPATALQYEQCNTPGSLQDNLAVLYFFNQPPDCSAAMANPDMLWPPNHLMKDIAIAGVTDPDGDPITFTVTGITQDEPVNGNGDGNTAPDGDGVGSATAQVRAERAGGGNGRVYEITFEAADDKGATCTASVQVCVPHDKQDSCIDDGQLYDSTSGAGAAPRVTTVLPDEIVALGAYPNPFNPTTTIAFTVAEAGPVTLVVYDVMGREVARLAEGIHAAGSYEAPWDARTLASGAYLVRLVTPSQRLTRQIVLMK